MSQFAFLQREWPAVFGAASKAEGAVRADPPEHLYKDHVQVECADCGCLVDRGGVIRRCDRAA